ncbi:hypothetical protein FB451DRAFT_402717 [Mycena latifolia]|nr:hypothetical protein FB451DRAFT_402717 [Mycena latifolia]
MPWCTLTTLSNCLAAIGMDDDALAAIDEAASIYSSSAPHMWQDNLYSLRKQELSGNMFHALSLRLATSGRIDESLLNAEKTTDLYRECASLAPRHLPTLASSLQNLAAMLWNVSRRDESVSACEEAVTIMRKVAEMETYFLGALGEALDQFAGYLLENGDAERAAAATSEAVDVRRKIKCLPPQQEFLLLAFETESEEEAEVGWATATKSEEYHDGATDIAEVVSEAASATSAQELPSTTQTVEAEVEGSNTPSAASQAAVPSPDEAATPPVESQSEERVARNIAKTRVADILNTPLKVELSSTPMDLLWWFLLGILSVVIAILGVALAVVWSSVP